MISFDEFMDNMSDTGGKRFDELMSKAENEKEKFRLEQVKWEFTVQQYEKAQLEEERKNLGFGSW